MGENTCIVILYVSNKNILDSMSLLWMNVMNVVIYVQWRIVRCIIVIMIIHFNMWHVIVNYKNDCINIFCFIDIVFNMNNFQIICALSTFLRFICISTLWFWIVDVFWVFYFFLVCYVILCMHYIMTWQKCTGKTLCLIVAVYWALVNK